MALEYVPLNAAQRETVEAFKAYNVVPEGSWFVGPIRHDGSIEVVGLGEGFAWSLLIEADGQVRSQEAKVGDWETGITC